MQQSRIKFDNRINAEFSTELKQRVQSYFADNNISSYANSAMLVKTVCMAVMAFGPYFLIMLIPMAGWMALLLCVVMGFGIAGIGLAVQHDANHGAYSSNDTVNRILGFSLSLIGGNDYMWRIKHNGLHHTYTNIYGKDEDISVAKMLRLAPTAEYRAIHKFQHYLAWIAYSTLTFFWVLYFDYPKIQRYNGNGSPNSEVKHPTKQLVLLFSMKIFYYIYAIILPVIVLDFTWWQVLLGFTFTHAIAGLVLSVVFQLAHVVEATDYPVPDKEGSIENSWFVHQMETTANFSRNNKLITWYVGGLNYQVEHHLFPKICSIHYPAISYIVEFVAEKYGVIYHNKNSFGQAVASHYRMLKRFSRLEGTDVKPKKLRKVRKAELAAI